MNKTNKVRKGEVRIYGGKTYVAIPEIKEDHCAGCCFYNEGCCSIRDFDHIDFPDCHNSGMIWMQWDMKIKLDVFEAIKNYAPDDILIISNQGGIEKGFVDREMFEYKFDYISNALEDYTDISVSAYYCESNNKRNANRKPNIGMIKEYMDFIEYMNNDEDEEEKIVYDTILMIGDASGKEGQFSDSDKKTAENFGCEYMDVDDFVDKYKD